MAFFAGTTVRLTAEFIDADGAKFDPTGVTVTIFDGNLQVIHAATPVNTAVGEYRFDYTVPANIFMVEFKGLDADAMPVLGRAGVEATVAY
jgi:hypothetical protein